MHEPGIYYETISCEVSHEVVEVNQWYCMNFLSSLWESERRYMKNVKCVCV